MFQKLLTFLRSAKAQNEAAAHIAGYDEAAGHLLRSVTVRPQTFQHVLADLEADARECPEAPYSCGIRAACVDFEAALYSRQAARNKSFVTS